MSIPILIAALVATTFPYVAEAQSLDVKKLDRLLRSQEYAEVTKTLGDRDDPETLAYLRSRYAEWHFPISAHFYGVTFRPALETYSKSPKSAPAQLELIETLGAWSRAKTILYVDRRDCKALTPLVKKWTEGFNIVSAPVQGVLGSIPGLMAKFGTGALAWAKDKESKSLRPPAIWLCGEGNIKPDQERLIARQNALAELEQQLRAVAADANTPNPAVQGTLRDKAAQRP
jgi:hypothetical protein